MKKCWRDEPNLRPSFEELRNKLSEMENQHKVELKSFRRDSLSPNFFSFENLNVLIYPYQIDSITVSPKRLRSVVRGFNLFRF